MKSVWVIAKNTYREIIRDRILYGIVMFSLLLIGFSLVLGQLSFDEQARISANFGFSGIHLGACILAIFVGSSLVAKEIEKQTILTLLARPISRTQFLLGKFLGLTGVIATVMSGLAMVLGLLMIQLNLSLSLSFAVALLGILMEAILLIAITLFFGTFARPIMTVIFSGALFLIGHWIHSLGYFISKSDSQSFKATAHVLQWILPDLERFNWRSAPIYLDTVPAAEFFMAGAYMVGWLILILTTTSLIFRRRDFV